MGETETIKNNNGGKRRGHQNVHSFRGTRGKKPSKQRKNIPKRDQKTVLTKNEDNKKAQKLPRRSKNNYKEEIKRSKGGKKS